MKLEETVNSHYRIIEELGECGIATVYKACDTVRGRDVALKVLKKEVLSPYVEDKIRFHKEFELVSKFNNPQIVRFYETGEHDGTLFLATELLEGSSFYELVKEGRVFKLEEVVAFIRQITDVLNFVHSQGIIHRDLNAGHVMLDRQGNIKLLDFGVSLIIELSKIKNEEDVISTFGYMSPEATGIVNKPVDERSDLYSLGVIFYQLLTRQLPFTGKTINELLHQQVAVIPPPPSKINLDIPKMIDDIVMKLLDKDPDLRYQSASGLAHDLIRFESGEPSFIIGEMDQRVKLRHNIRLVGRDVEFNTIKGLVGQAKSRKGNICLIAGEAGSGKSRLVEEIRGYVCEQDGIFFTGKCFDQENKVPYKPFKDITEEYLKRLKQLDKDVAQKEIARLKKVLAGEIREITKLNPAFEEIVSDVPPLAPLDDPEKENVRFRLTCSKFFTSLTLDEKEVVLFFDDLQWADDGSLILIEELVRIIGNSNVLILGTYRSNEVDDHHGLNRIKKNSIQRGHTVHEIPLQMFNYERMRRLVAETLGEPPDKAERLGRFLMDKTAGNPFFAITFLKELVERKILTWDKGYWREDWERIEKLPVTESIIDMVILRTSALPEKVDRLLKIASIVGKEFEMPMLYELITENQGTIVELVDEAIERELLEKAPEKNKFIFVHDRIKEAFDKKMSEEEKIGFHLRIGEVLETQNKGKEADAAFDLAHHFIKGRNKEKALHYSLIAAEKARFNYANKEAIKIYNYVKDMILEKEGKSENYLAILENLGEVSRREGMHEEALKSYNEAIALTQTRIRKASISQRLGETYFYMGQLDKAISILEETLKFLDFKTTPHSKPVIIANLILETVIQNLHYAFPGIFKNDSKKKDERYIIAVRTCLRLSYCYLYVDLMKAILVELRSVNMVDKMKGTREYAYVYILQVPMYACAPMFPLGDRYAKEGLRAAIEVKDKLMEGFAYVYQSMLKFAENKLDEAVESGRKGTEIVLPLGERWDITIGYAFPCFAHYAKGEPALMRKAAEDLNAAAAPADDLRSVGRPLYFIGRSLMITNEVKSDLIQKMERGLKFERKVKEDTFISMALVGLTLAYAKAGNLDEAIKKGEEGVSILLKAAAPGFWASDVFGITASVYLMKIEQGVDAKTKEEHLKRVETLCKSAMSWGGKYKAYLGLALRVRGKYLWIKGKRKEAIRDFEKGIRFLEAYQYKYELALSLFEFGKLLYRDGFSAFYNSEKGKVLLTRAKEIFKEIGANPDLKEVNRVLAIEDKEVGSDVTARTRLKLEREMSTVLETISDISSILDVDELLDKIMVKTMQLSGSERGVMFLYPDGSRIQGLVPNVVKNVTTTEMEGGAFDLVKSIVAKVEQGQETIVIDESSMGEDGRKLNIKLVGSAVCIPVKNRENMLGVIYLDNRLISGLYGGEDLQVLELIGRQAGISIDNALLYKKATIDGLTKLYNRNFFENHCRQTVEEANRYSRELSLLMLDVDHFKSCNDTHGHQAGDAVLQHVAGLLKGTMRKSDMPARYGGEEFVVVLPETGLKGALTVAENVRQTIEKNEVSCKVGQKDLKIKVTISIGAAQLLEGENMMNLITRADKALYKAKEGGRNRVET